MSTSLKDIFEISEIMDDKVLLKLLTALSNAQSKDFDYLKFKQSYKSLIGLGMDESTAARSAFLTASTMGLTKEKLMMTVQHYKNTLNSEKEQFALALKNQIANNVDARVLEVNRLNEKISENNRKMEQMKKENEIIGQQIVRVSQEAEASKSKIEDTRNKFVTTFDALYREIDEDGTLYDKIL